MGERFVSKWSLMHHTEIPVLREGVPSFMGVPVARGPRDLERADAVILGIPYDRPATAGRPAGQWAGYRRAPADVRRHSLKYAGYLPELELDVFDHLRLVDYGDADIADGDDVRSIESVSRTVRDVMDAGCGLITLGGFSPCASYAVVKGVAASTQGTVGVISLDAHGDTLDEEPQGGPGPASSTWEARMWDHFKNVDPTRHVEIGIRGPRNTRQQVEAYRKRGAHLWTAPAVHRLGVDALCLDALPRAVRGVERAWLHLDMDVLDISASPDWGDEPLGLSARDVMTIVHESGKRGIDALSFVYIAPNSPSIAAIVSYTVVYLLAGWVLGGRLKRR